MHGKVVAWRTTAQQQHNSHGEWLSMAMAATRAARAPHRAHGHMDMRSPLDGQTHAACNAALHRRRSSTHKVPGISIVARGQAPNPCESWMQRTTAAQTAACVNLHRGSLYCMTVAFGTVGMEAAYQKSSRKFGRPAKTAHLFRRGATIAVWRCAAEELRAA